MGFRRTILTTLKTTIHGIVADNGQVVSATNTYIDPTQESIANLPKVSIVPGAETIQVGLFGQSKDRFCGVQIVGYVPHKVNTADLFLDAEDVIEIIVNTLTSNTNAQAFIALNFGIASIGPIISDQAELEEDIAYISIPLSIEFLEG